MATILLGLARNQKTSPSNAPFPSQYDSDPHEEVDFYLWIAISISMNERRAFSFKKISRYEQIMAGIKHMS